MTAADRNLSGKYQPLPDYKLPFLRSLFATLSESNTENRLDGTAYHAIALAVLLLPEGIQSLHFRELSTHKTPF